MRDGDRGEVGGRGSDWSRGGKLTHSDGNGRRVGGSGVGGGWDDEGGKRGFGYNDGGSSGRNGGRAEGGCFGDLRGGSRSLARAALNLWWARGDLQLKSAHLFKI